MLNKKVEYANLVALDLRHSCQDLVCNEVGTARLR